MSASLKAVHRYNMINRFPEIREFLISMGTGLDIIETEDCIIKPLLTKMQLKQGLIDSKWRSDPIRYIFFLFDAPVTDVVGPKVVINITASDHAITLPNSKYIMYVDTGLTTCNAQFNTLVDLVIDAKQNYRSNAFQQGIVPNRIDRFSISDVPKSPKLVSVLALTYRIMQKDGMEAGGHLRQ